MEKTLKALTKLPSKMGKIADVVNNIIDHIKNGGGGGGGVDFTPGKPLELTANKVLRLDKNYVLSPFKVDNNGYIRLALDSLHLEEEDGSVNIHTDNNLYFNAVGDIDFDSNGVINLNSTDGIYLYANNTSEIELNSSNRLYLSSGNKEAIDLQANGSVLLYSNNGYDIELHSNGGIILNSNNANDINIDSNGGVYLFSNNGYEISLNSNQGVYLFSDNGENIELSSNASINLYSDNDGTIELNSNGAIYLYSDNGSDIEISSHASVLLFSKHDGYIQLGTRESDYERNLILNGNTGGLEYNQDGDVYFKIYDNGHVHILNSDNDLMDITPFVPYENDIVIPINLYQFVGDAFTLIVTTIFGEQRIRIDNNTQNITINYNENYPYVIISFDALDTAFAHTDYITFDKNDGNTIDINCSNTSIIPDIKKITRIVTHISFCYTADTLITLADGSTKQVKDITYDDELKVWNFDEGKDDVAKPLWIKRIEHAKSYQLVTLSDGNTIKLCGSDGKYHCMFDVTEQKFNHAVDCIGHKVYTENGIVTVVSIEEVKEKVEHYNIVTNYHMNLYANHILTSTEKNNIYPIVNMKFVKDDRKIVPYEEFEKAHISREYYDGWRAGEWNEPLKDVITHLRRRKIYAKPQKSVKNGLRTDYFG